MLLAKLDHYGIRAVSNDWFKAYLSNCNQYVSINGYDSGLNAISLGVPKGSVLGPLLFLQYINNLNRTITFSKVHHFADDTNLLCLCSSIKKLNKLVNADFPLIRKTVYRDFKGNNIATEKLPTKESVETFWKGI